MPKLLLCSRNNDKSPSFPLKTKAHPWLRGHFNLRYRHYLKCVSKQAFLSYHQFSLWLFFFDKPLDLMYATSTTICSTFLHQKNGALEFVFFLFGNNIKILGHFCGKIPKLDYFLVLAECSGFLVDHSCVIKRRMSTSMLSSRIKMLDRNVLRS